MVGNQGNSIQGNFPQRNGKQSQRFTGQSQKYENNYQKPRFPPRRTSTFKGKKANVLTLMYLAPIARRHGTLWLVIIRSYGFLRSLSSLMEKKIRKQSGAMEFYLENKGKIETTITTIKY